MWTIFKPKHPVWYLQHFHLESIQMQNDLHVWDHYEDLDAAAVRAKAQTWRHYEHYKQSCWLVESVNLLSHWSPDDTTNLLAADRGQPSLVCWKVAVNGLYSTRSKVYQLLKCYLQLYMMYYFEKSIMCIPFLALMKMLCM